MMLCHKSRGLIFAMIAASAIAFSPSQRQPSSVKKVSSSGFSPSLLRDVDYSSVHKMVASSSVDASSSTYDSNPTFGYDKFNSKKETYEHEVVGVVESSPQDTYTLAADWSKDGVFWNKYMDLTHVQDSGEPNMVGSTRKFSLNGRDYEEVLLDNNPDKLEFAYGYNYGNPPLIKAAVTYCTFEPVEGNDFLTKVTWRVVVQPAFEYPNFVKMVKDGQAKAYEKVIATLQSFSAPDPRSPAEILGSGAMMIVKDIAEKVNDITSTMVTTTAEEDWDYAEYASFEDGLLPKHARTLPAECAIMPKRAGMIFERSLQYAYCQTPLLGYISELANIVKDPEIVVALSKVDGGPMIERMVEHMFEANIDDQVAIAMEIKGLLGTPEATKHLANEQGKKLIDAVQVLANDPFLAPFVDNQTFNWVKEPKQIIENFKNPETNDLEIAAQLIRGVNPLKITVASKADDLPTELQGLTDPSGRSVEELIAAKSLFYTDYWECEVGDLDKEKGVYYNQAKGIGGVGKIGPMKYYYAPKLAVYKNEEGKLDILGFTLTRFDDKPNVVYSKDSPENIYKLAKLHLTCADNQQHQFVSHLGMAHLNMEPFAVANHNAFPTNSRGDRHPVGRLLHPHFQDTIGINYLARQTLVSNVAPFTDATFSPGTVNALKIFSKAYQVWDFFGDNFPGHLKKRGFDEEGTDGLEGYYYRDDGFKLWNLFKDHFTRIVDKIYDSDRDVRKDRALDDWCDEVRGKRKAAMSSFPKKFKDKETLVEAMTTIVFYCSAQHAAVNFSQKDYVSYLPNRPDNLILPMQEPREGETDIGEEIVCAALPSLVVGEFQAMFSYLLSCPPDNPFDLYSGDEEFKEENELFVGELTKLHEEITARNKELEAKGEVGYEYLDPFLVPQSINI